MDLDVDCRLSACQSEAPFVGLGVQYCTEVEVLEIGSCLVETQDSDENVGDVIDAVNV